MLGFLCRDGVAVLAAEPEIRDPFFAFVIELVDKDSLGVWSGEDIRDCVARSGRESRLPLEHFQRLERRRATVAEREWRRGARVSRMWRLTLDEDLDLPMPYSILGYHPGTLRISRELVLSEWPLGERNIHVIRADTVAVLPASGLTAFRLDRGWVVLDVDGLLDRLLGKKLDDSWTVGFALGRVEGVLQGLGLAYSRKKRKLYGEIDFREDKILVHGRPVARGLSRFIRPWTRPRPGMPERIWEYDH